jgi:hypothetical protein
LHLWIQCQRCCMQSGVNSKYCIELRDPSVPFHSFSRWSSLGKGRKSLLQCLPRGLLSVPNAHPQSTYIYRVQSRVRRLPNYWPPTPPPPLHPASVSSPSTKGGGGYTLGGRWGGWGVNISEDAGHWIGLLQYYPSTCSHCKYLDVGHVNVNHLMAVLWKNTLLDTQLGDKDYRRVK